MPTGDDAVGKHRTWAALALFFTLSYALTWACWLPLVANRGDFSRLPVSPETLATLGQFGPFTAAVVIGLWGGLRDFLRCLFRVWVNPLWYVVALLLPPALAVGAIHIQSGLTGQRPELVWPDLFGDCAPQLVYILLLGGPLGEEPGWRGFALPRLQAACPPLLATLVLALVWAGWHLPLWWVADVPCPFPFYVVGVIPLTYLFTWLSDWSGGSVPVALVFHSSINTCIARLPLFPAFEAWTALLWVAAVVAFVIDRRVPTGDRHQT
jgi:membrane protease YdiL (CAAX protease family)